MDRSDPSAASGGAVRNDPDKVQLRRGRPPDWFRRTPLMHPPLNRTLTRNDGRCICFGARSRFRWAARRGARCRWPSWRPPSNGWSGTGSAITSTCWTAITASDGEHAGRRAGGRASVGQPDPSGPGPWRSSGSLQRCWRAGCAKRRGTMACRPTLPTWTHVSSRQTRKAASRVVHPGSPTSLWAAPPGSSRAAPIRRRSRPPSRQRPGDRPEGAACSAGRSAPR